MTMPNIQQPNDPVGNRSADTSYLENWAVHLPPDDLAIGNAVLGTGLDWEALTGGPLHRRR